MDTPQTPLPLGFWLRAADRILAQRVADALTTEGVTRREWRALNVIAGRMPRPERPMPDAQHPRHRGPRRSIESLIARGWVARGADGPTLTEDGTAALDRLTDVVTVVRASVSELVDVAQLQSSLQALVRGLGWEEAQPLPGRSGRRGPGHHHGRSGERGHHRTRDGSGAHERGHGRSGERAHGHRQATIEAAFERGYTRGFEAGRIS